MTTYFNQKQRDSIKLLLGNLEEPLFSIRLEPGKMQTGTATKNLEAHEEPA